MMKPRLRRFFAMQIRLQPEVDVAVKYAACFHDLDEDDDECATCRGGRKDQNDMR